MDSLLTHLIAFLVGAATGATGKYFADKYTDQRRALESGREARKAFASVRKLMPGLIEEMRTDLLKPENASAREFYLLPNPNVGINRATASLAYYESVHPDLAQHVVVLLNHNYLQDVTSTNVQRYRMTEHFVQCLRGEL